MQKCSWHTCIKRRKAGLEIYHNSDLIFKVLYTHIHIEWAIHCRLLVLIFSKWVMDKVFTFSLRLWIFFYNKYDWLFLQLVSYKSSYEKESRQKCSKWLFQSSCSRLMLRVIPRAQISALLMQALANCWGNYLDLYPVPHYIWTVSGLST